MATITQALKDYEAALCKGTASEAEKLMGAVSAVIELDGANSNGNRWVLCQDLGPEGLSPPFFVFNSEWDAEQAQAAIDKLLPAPLTKIVRSDKWPDG